MYVNLSVRHLTAQFYEPKFFSFHKERQKLVGGNPPGRGSSILFTQKATFDENLIRKPSNIYKLIVGIEASIITFPPSDNLDNKIYW